MLEDFNREYAESLYMDVWSAEKFASGEIDTWPFEHDYILAFRGTSREIFFPHEHSSSVKDYPGGKDKKLASVPNTRYLIPMNNNGNTGQISFEDWKEWYIQKLKQEEGLTDEEAERVWKEFLDAGKERTDTIKQKYDDDYDWRRFTEAREAELSVTADFLTVAEKCLTGEDLKGPGYPQVRKQLYQLLEKQTEYFSSRNNSEWNKGIKQGLEARFKEKNVSNIRELFRNLDSYLDTVQNIEEEIEEIRKEEKQKVNQEDWNEEQYEKERRIEYKIERRLAKEIIKLPNIKALNSEIEEKLRKARKEREQVSEGENPPRNNYPGINI